MQDAITILFAIGFLLFAGASFIRLQDALDSGHPQIARCYAWQLVAIVILASLVALAIGSGALKP